MEQLFGDRLRRLARVAVTMSSDEAIIDTAREWCGARHKVAIATVIATWGSAPRRVGSHLVVREDGIFEGSVSGGCVEGDVITEALTVIREGRSKRLDYGVADARAWEVGLACGGRIAILVQALVAGQFDPVLLDRIAAGRDAGESVTLVTDLSTGTTREAETGEFVRVYSPPLRLAIIGAVHIAQALVPVARLLGYTPLVIDPRGLFATSARFDDVTLDDGWPDEALARWRPNAACAVVALTHDPKLDDVGLAAALRSPAFYIAALGSRKSHAARLDRLGALGFDEATLTRVHGPAGLAIGAANPAEIALSIAAQMTAAWRGRL